MFVVFLGANPMVTMDGQDMSGWYMVGVLWPAMERAHLPMQQQDHSTVHGPIGPALCFVLRKQNLGLGPNRDLANHSERHLK